MCNSFYEVSAIFIPNDLCGENFPTIVITSYFVVGDLKIRCVPTFKFNVCVYCSFKLGLNLDRLLCFFARIFVIPRLSYLYIRKDFLPVFIFNP